MKTYYEATANQRPVFPSLSEDIQVDICILGAGYTGLLTALELSEKGYSVAILEAQTVGFGASGRNGGQIATGYQPGMIQTEKVVGKEDAERLWRFSTEATCLLRDRVQHHGITCDLRDGELYTAAKARHVDWLRREQAHCESRYGFSAYEWVSQEKLADYLDSTRYHGALLDREGGHLHPLNYALGLASAVKKANIPVFENSRALEIVPEAQPCVKTAIGQITANSIVLAGNAYLEGLHSRLESRIMPVRTYIMATEPLGEDRARQLMKTDACVSDTNSNLDYFRMSADHRLLYGGRDYVGDPRGDQTELLRRHMLHTFPQLSDLKIDYIWSGKVAVTRHLLPDFGRVGSNIYYVQGYSGQGLPLSAIAAKVMAQAIAGDTERFDVFARIPHKPFPGGTRFRVPLLSLAMFYQRLRDLL
jgi:gamma-glutamylputrescine oxidase